MDFSRLCLAASRTTYRYSSAMGLDKALDRGLCVRKPRGSMLTLSQVAQVEHDAIRVIPRMLREVCRKLEILNSYCSYSTILTQTAETCFEIALLVLDLTSSALQFMRKDLHLLVDEDGTLPDPLKHIRESEGSRLCIG